MNFLSGLNYVYRVELIAITAIILLLLYIFWALKIFKKN
jgi:hypothetical protein